MLDVEYRLQTFSRDVAEIRNFTRQNGISTTTTTARVLLAALSLTSLVTLGE